MAKAKSSCFPTDLSRHKVLHNYHDHARVKSASEVDSHRQDNGEKRKGPRGGVTVPFPTKLHVMLSKVEDAGLSHIVSWQPHGRCFMVHKPKEFVSEVMPTYFRQSKLTSFQRQLNLYGFARITTGRDRGGYYHELFMKHRLFLCQKMTRIRVKGTGIKGKASPETEPDFYSMPWVEPDDSSADMNFDLECEVAAALEEENRHCDRGDRSVESKGQVKGRKKKQKVAGKSPEKSTDAAADEAHPSQKNTSSVYEPVPVTPDTIGSRDQFYGCPRFQSGTNQRSNNAAVEPQNILDLCPPLLSLDTKDKGKEELMADDEISFEGQRFHYLNSFAKKAPPSSFNLGPRKLASAASYSSAHMLPSSHESYFFATQSLCGPILSPSPSSSPFSLTKHNDENIEINPETFFSDNAFDDDLETRGEELDISI